MSGQKLLDPTTYFMLRECILGKNQPDYYLLCRLITGYSNIEDLWSNDLPSLCQVFLNGHLLWALWRTTRTGDVTNGLCRHSIVYGWFRKARNWGLADFVPYKQMYSAIHYSAKRVTGLAAVLPVTLQHYSVQYIRTLHLHSVLPATVILFRIWNSKLWFLWIALCTRVLAAAVVRSVFFVLWIALCTRVLAGVVRSVFLSFFFFFEFRPTLCKQLILYL